MNSGPSDYKSDALPTELYRQRHLTSQSICPLQADSCQARHLGVVMKGTVAARHDDGTEMTYSEGDAYAIAPGHDGWVVGDEEAVVFEFHGAWGE